MASKNLLLVVALCGALATGTPIAAWATPVMADSLPAALSPAPDPSSVIACKRFSLTQATVSTSGCLRQDTDSSIVVDIKRSDKTNGSQAGCAICTWRSVALDADDDPCDLELRIDIASVDDSANEAKVAFDSAFFEEEGGVCLGCVVSHADGAQPTLSFTASLRITKASTDAVATGETPPCCSTPTMPEAPKSKTISKTGRSALLEGRNPALSRSMSKRKTGSTYLPTRRSSKWNGMELEPSGSLPLY